MIKQARGCLIGLKVYLMLLQSFTIARVRVNNSNNMDLASLNNYITDRSTTYTYVDDHQHYSNSIYHINSLKNILIPQINKIRPNLFHFYSNKYQPS